MLLIFLLLACNDKLNQGNGAAPVAPGSEIIRKKRRKHSLEVIVIFV